MKRSLPNFEKRLHSLLNLLIMAAVFLSAGLFASTARAQVIADNYIFSSSTGTFVPLPSSATRVPDIESLNAVSGPIPIGFVFNFNEYDFTTVYACTRGFLSFSPSVSGSAGNDLDKTPSNNRAVIAPLWDNLDGRAAGGSKASYETTGQPGSRVFTFEWYKFEWNSNSTDPVMSFQVKLYEGSNKIEFIYRQEAGAAVSPSASIGLAGYTPTPGDFVSVNNSGIASFTTESFVTTKPATGQIYTFSRVKFPLDVTATQIISPVAPEVYGCYGPNETMAITIKNVGNTTLNLATNPVTVSASVTLGTTTTNLPPVIVSTGTLAPDSTRNVTVTNSLNMTTAGTYTLNASATVAGDGRTRNDAMAPVTYTLTQRNVPGAASLPQSLNFSAFTGGNLHTIYPDWSEGIGSAAPALFYSNWSDDIFANNPIHPNGKAARVPITYYVTTNSWMVSPKFTPGPATKLVFDLAMTLLGTTNSSTLGSDDKFQVMISTDCGVSYSPLRTFNASTPISSGGQVEVIDLAPYSGQSVIIGFYATVGSVIDYVSNEIFVDNIFIGTPPAIDMGATALAAPATAGCYSASEPVVVTVQNFATDTIDFSQRPVVVSATVSGAANTILSTSLNAGKLAPGETKDVTVGNLNMSAAGTYSFTGRTFLTMDLQPANNSSSAFTRTVKPVVTLPQIVDFTGYNGANLPALFPNWYEASGATPAAATSNWAEDDFANMAGSTKGKASRIQLSGNQEREWIISPKFTPNATTKLRFDLALTTAGASTATTMGSDDLLQVMVSTDCGVTFSAIKTYSASTPISHTGQIETIDLASYSGQNIIVAFFATDGTVADPQHNDLFIDNILIGTPPPIDMAAIAFVSPNTSACHSASEPVAVTIQNYGTATINFATTPATLTVNISGAGTQTLTFTLNTGTLAPGATQQVTVGSANLYNTGLYTFSGNISVSGDGNAANNNFPAVSITYSTIANFPHTQDFELFTPAGGNAAGNASWTGTATGYRWKTGAGAVSATTGPAADHTVGLANGKYVYTDASLGAAGDVAELISPCIDLTGQTGIGLEFWYHLFGSGIDTLHVDVFNGSSWVNDVWYRAGQQQTSGADLWKQAFVNLAPFNGNVINIRFRGGRSSNTNGNIALDDVRLYQLAPVELEIVSLSLPDSRCGMTTAETICMTIVNNGSTTITSMPVSYTINGGTPVTETATVSVAPAATVQYCFTTKANLSAAGTYTIEANVNVLNDADANNNTLSGTVMSIPTITAYPYLQDFESGNGGWRAGGNNATWAMGTPAASLINSAASGSNAWVTNLSGTYANNENSYVLGPCFNFSGIANPAVSLKIWRDAEDKMDGAVLQSSVDGGLTWQVVGTYGAPNNWYNRDSIAANPGGQPASANGNFAGWSGTSTGWATATHALSGLGGKANVQLRVAFASNAGTVQEGFAFDDVQVYNIVAAPAITAGGPTTFCPGDSVVLTAASATPGVSYRWYHNGTLISGATGASYTARLSGSYTAEAILGGSGISAPLVVSLHPVPATPAITQTGNTLTATAATGYQWYLNGTAIAGATAQTYVATATGTYAVVITDANGCTSLPSSTVHVQITGVQEAWAARQVQVYPNPASGSFFLKLTGYDTEAEVALYNLAGQLVFRDSMAAGEAEKNYQLNDLAAGTYLLKVTSEKNVAVTRLVVQQ